MSESLLQPFLLEPWFSPRPWGTLDLAPWYTFKPTEPIGEAWLTGEACTIATGPVAGVTFGELVKKNPDQILGKLTGAFADYPLLLKILFPHDKLSVQVHPDDALAQASGQLRGKTECWYVLSAEPGASVALGLQPGTDGEAMRRAIADNTMEALMVEVPVSVGDMVFVDAGTVHAIGPGVILLETQQTSDITYRLYDYGRPRELHIEPGIAATRFQTAAGKVPPLRQTQSTLLITQKYFAVDQFVLPPGKAVDVASTGTPQTLVLVAGEATVTTEGGLLPLKLGQAAIVPAALPAYSVSTKTGGTFIRSIPPML